MSQSPQEKLDSLEKRLIFEYVAKAVASRRALADDLASALRYHGAALPLSELGGHSARTVRRWADRGAELTGSEAGLPGEGYLVLVPDRSSSVSLGDIDEEADGHAAAAEEQGAASADTPEARTGDVLARASTDAPRSAHQDRRSTGSSSAGGSGHARADDPPGDTGAVAAAPLSAARRLLYLRLGDDAPDVCTMHEDASTWAAAEGALRKTPLPDHVNQRFDGKECARLWMRRRELAVRAHLRTLNKKRLSVETVAASGALPPWAYTAGFARSGPAASWLAGVRARADFDVDAAWALSSAAEDSHRARRAITARFRPWSPDRWVRAMVDEAARLPAGGGWKRLTAAQEAVRLGHGALHAGTPADSERLGPVALEGLTGCSLIWLGAAGSRTSVAQLVHDDPPTLRHVINIMAEVVQEERALLQHVSRAATGAGPKPAKRSETRSNAAGGGNAKANTTGGKPPRRKFEGKCYNCDEEGHPWRRCPKPRRPDLTGPSKSSSNNGRGHE